MSDPKFTPGPWKIKPYKHYMNRKSYVVRNTHTITTESGLREICKVLTGLKADGNLHLIAAAPEMYEMLEEILARELIAPEKTQTLNDIKELLKKARGEK